MEVKDKVVIITGGGGELGGAMAEGLAKLGAKVILWGRTEEALREQCTSIEQQGGFCSYFQCDVLNETMVKEVTNQIQSEFGRIDGLINAAGGNKPGATISPDGHFHDIPIQDLDQVMRLNFLGTLIPCKLVTKVMIEQGYGSVINISSMAATKPLTRVVGYAASKAAIDNYTKWMAVEMATKYSPSIRVNAIAPGFFIGKQNRSLLLEKDGSYTPRAQSIISHTPMHRFGRGEELVGAAQWLLSDQSGFVTGVIIPVDGGFSAYAGI